MNYFNCETFIFFCSKLWLYRRMTLIDCSNSTAVIGVSFLISSNGCSLNIFPK